MGNATGDERANAGRENPAEQVLDYHRPSSVPLIVRLLRWLPRPSWPTVAILILTVLAAACLRADHAAWVVIPR